jgi:tetratricopeptide (TPR) repeat protein
LRGEAKLEGLYKAIEYFNQAIENDPCYALAYAGLADAYTLLGSGTYGAMPSKNARAHSTEMAVKALEMDNTLAEAHTSLAFVRFRFDWDWQGAEREFQASNRVESTICNGPPLVRSFFGSDGPTG